MAIKWGSWVSSRFRIGLDITQSPATFTSSVTTVNVNAKLYWQTYYYGWDTGINWSISGAASASGTTDFDHNGDMQYTLMGQVNKTVTPVVTGTITSTFSGSASGWSAYSGTATVSDSHVTQKKPFSIPSAPTGVGATRVSDTQHTITWTRNATSGAPYETLHVERWDNVSNKYVAIATLSGSATSYSNTNTVANRQYRWRVRARNDAGYSGYNYSGYLKTTPAAPGTPTATKTATGDIQLTWAGNSAIAENIEVWHAANGVWDGAALATLGVVTSYTHTAPNAAQTHAYRLRSKIATPALTSAYSGTSNTVQLQAPPNAPTNLTPNGEVKDATGAINFYWQHNPVDTTPQRKRQSRHRINAGAWVENSIITSTESWGTFPANFFGANGSTVEWQMRTWGAATTGGADGTGASPWSASATIVLSSKPTVAINFPDLGVPVTTSTLTVEWGYFDAEASPQSSWKVWLNDNLGNQLEYKTGNGTDTSVALSTVLQDGVAYELEVQVRDGAGAWSDIVSMPFTIDYAPPPTPTPTLGWEEPTATVDIALTVGAPAGGEVAAVTMNVYRSEDEGVTYTRIAKNLVPNSTWVDMIPPLNKTVYYQVEAVSATPSAAVSAPVTVYTSSFKYRRIWINVGPGFEKGTFLSPQATIDMSLNRNKTLHEFAGRPLPVEFSGINIDRVFNVKGVLIRDTTDEAILTPQWDELEEVLLDYPAPACLRDLRGHRWFVSVNNINWGGPHRRIQDVGFTATQIDWEEDVL